MSGAEILKEGDHDAVLRSEDFILDFLGYRSFLDGSSTGGLSEEHKSARSLDPQVFQGDVPLSSRYASRDELLQYALGLDRLVSFDQDFERLIHDLEAREGGFLPFMNQSPAQAFKMIDGLLGKYFSEKLQARITDPNSPLKQTIKDVFEDQNWNSVSDQSALQIILLDLYAKLTHLRGAIVQSYVASSPEAKAMGRVAQIEYTDVSPIIDVTNRFFIKWNYELSRVLTSEQRKERGLTDQFAIISKNGDGEPMEVKWHEAYPEECRELSRRYAHLAGKLADTSVTLSSEEQKICRLKIAYYSALSAAWATCDLEAWRIADALLPQQTAGANIPVHIHPIETGYSRDEVQRVPEVSLRYPDNAFEAINRLALETRARMAATLGKFFLNETPPFSRYAKRTLHLMEGSIFAARHFMGGGMEMVFRPAGQLLPNELGSRIRGGVDISCDPVTMSKRLPLIREAFQVVFGFEMPEFDIVKAAGRYTAGHEFGHAVGLTPTTGARLDETFMNTFTEEWKASAGGLILNEYFAYLDGEKSDSKVLETPRVTMEDLTEAVSYWLIMCPRYTSMRHDPHARPYFRQSVRFANVAQDVGILLQDGDRWHFVLSDEKVIAFCERVFAQYKETLQIYDSGSLADLRRTLERDLQSTPFVEYMAERLDAHFERKDSPSAAEICRLPDVNTAAASV